MDKNSCVTQELATYLDSQGFVVESEGQMAVLEAAIAWDRNQRLVDAPAASVAQESVVEYTQIEAWIYQLESIAGGIAHESPHVDGWIEMLLTEMRACHAAQSTKDAT